MNKELRATRGLPTEEVLDEMTDRDLVSYLFPRRSPNPWTDLPVNPRDEPRFNQDVQGNDGVGQVRTRVDGKQFIASTVVEGQQKPLSSNKHRIINKLKTKHLCYGHPPAKMLSKMLSQSGVKADRELAKYFHMLPRCDACLLGKPRQKSHPKDKVSTRAAKKISDKKVNN